MTNQIVTLQDNAGNNLYPQVKWDGVTDFPGFPKLPTDYLKKNDIKRTDLSGSDLTGMNGVTWVNAITKGVLLEFPGDFAIFYFGTNFNHVNCKSFQRADLARLPVSFFSKYNKFMGNAKLMYTNHGKWVNMYIQATSDNLERVGLLSCSARHEDLVDDKFDFEQTMYMSK